LSFKSVSTGVLGGLPSVIWWRQLTVQTSGVLQSGGILKIGEWKENAPLIFDHFTGRIAVMI
jgi:hypothetical protein